MRSPSEPARIDRSGKAGASLGVDGAAAGGVALGIDGAAAGGAALGVDGAAAGGVALGIEAAPTVLRADKIRREPEEREHERVPLALAIHRGGLGYELQRPFAVGPLRLTALDVSLPGLRFPLDVTGGLARFRHRRGVLEHVAFELPYAALERFLSVRLAGLLGPRPPHVQVTRISGNTLAVCVVDQTPAITPWLRTLQQGERPRALPRARVLTFDALLDTGDLTPSDDTLRVLIARARGAGLDAPPTLLALRVLDALAAASGGERVGAALHLTAAARALARTLLPLAGLRAPDTTQVHWHAHRIDDGAIVCIGARALAPRDAAPRSAGAPSRTDPARSGRNTASPAHVDAAGAPRSTGASPSRFDGSPCEPSDAESTRWRESWRLLQEVDDAWVAGDDVRAGVLAVLERAPKLPEALRRLAEIDALAASARAEAALATLRETNLGPLGTLAAELAAASGDLGGAVGILLQEAAHEPVPALAAELCVRAAESETDVLESLRWLDLALAHVPAHLPARAARFYRRLCAGKIALAQADVEHLEAQAEQGRERHELLLAVGQLYAQAGHARECVTFFERALRQLPDDPDALAGLGHALAAIGRTARGAALLARAIDLADPLDAPARRSKRARRAAQQTQADPSWMRLTLAELLAEQLGDEPAAIARLARIPEQGLLGARARALEARYRLRLGERAAASLAYARLREIARHFLGEPGQEPSAAARFAADALEAAARFEEHERGDRASAARHLEVAVALVPTSAALRATYQSLLDRSHPQAPSPEPLEPSEPQDLLAQTPHEILDERPSNPLHFTDPLRSVATETEDAPDDEILAEDLRHRFLQNPHDVEVQTALVSILERTGRGLELLALVVGMLEDAQDDAARASLLPVRNRVLEQLENAARARGSDAEADLYRMSRES